MSETASAIARAQLAAFRQQDRLEPLLSQLGGNPAELRKAAAWSPAGFPGLPAQLREANAEELDFSANDLAYRRLYPGLDIGIYACSHSMGVPSVVGPALVREQLDQLATMGIQVWENGLWVKVMDQYRQVCAQLVGGSLEAGDVAWFPNVSEALSAVLEGLGKGKLVYSSGHFTTGHYVHHQWAQNTGGTLVEVSVEADGSLPTEKLMAAVDADTTVLSISHALFESGWLQDLPAIAAQLKAKAPNAMLLVDAYQTAGTVPLEATALGDHVV
ncbi:MAG TPA: aminotransferase class V-fold PLP-dependent enzyme, partial [Myxococcota bacterium]|nr:aminotransferase class V-fold PLP-dependent enzyme [Myxococcota bacterium]